MAKETSKFANLALVNAGKRESKDTQPEISTSTIFNKFDINGLLSREMGLEDGDYVMFMDDRSGKDPKAPVTFGLVKAWQKLDEEGNPKTYVNKAGEEVADMGSSAKLASAGHVKGFGNSLSFNYSGIFNLMLAVDNSSGDVKIADLINDGLLEKDTTEKGAEVLRPTIRKYFKIGSYENLEIEGEVRRVAILEFDREEKIERD